MHCPDLVNIFNLIRYYSDYSSDAAIAERLEIDRSNIRNYLYDHADAPYIPIRRHADFQNFFSEILSSPVSLVRTKALLTGDADTFHSLISPITGKSWAHLIGQSKVQPRLLVRKRPPPTLGFGTSTRIHNQPAEFEIKIGDEFTIEATFPMNGEAVVFAENAGSWHIIPADENSPTFSISGRSKSFPPYLNDERAFLLENGPTGFYRYFLVGVRGKFTRTLRDHLHSANPLTQPKLDVIADMILSGDGAFAVLGATIRVTEQEPTRH